MALATRCPNCHALFRVVADQLKLRGGLVRCGACNHVFDAISTLSYIDEAATAPAPALLTVEAAPAIERPPAVIDVAPAPATVDATPPESPTETTGEAEPETASFVEATSADATIDAEPTETTTAGAAVEPAVTLSPAEATNEDSLEATPAFLRERSGSQRRGLSIFFGAGATLLLVLLLAQLVTMFRAEILVRMPGARPALDQLCRLFACTVNWPARGELLAVVGSDLQALPGSDALELTAVVRNRAAFTLAMPAIELTLTDAQNRTLVRKVFAPADYLGTDASTRMLAGLEAGGDLTVRIAFEARGVNATGFIVYPFYL